MTHTHFWSDGTPANEMAVGYAWAKQGLRVDGGMRLTIDGVAPASSGIESTVQDLAKWDAGLSSGKLLSRASLLQMWQPQHLKDGTQSPWGLGWEIGRFDGAGPQWVGHGGSSGGYTCSFVRYRNGPTIMFLTNLGYLDLGETPKVVWKCFEPQSD